LINRKHICLFNYPIFTLLSLFIINLYFNTKEKKHIKNDAKNAKIILINFFILNMEILSRRPNILFLIWVRNNNINFLFNQKLNKQLYYRKLINALTTIEYNSSLKIWTVNGKIHREDGPARIENISNNNPNGTNYGYFSRNLLHRDDGPASICGITKENPNGTYQSYYQHDKLHREDGPALIYGISKENPNGTYHAYYKHRQRHRKDGPAIIQEISKENPNGTYHAYYKHGQRHRNDGPAIIEEISKKHPNGYYHAYYQHGKRVDPF